MFVVVFHTLLGYLYVYTYTNISFIFWSITITSLLFICLFFIQNIQLCLLGTISNLLLWHTIVNVEVGVRRFEHILTFLVSTMSHLLCTTCLIAKIGHTFKKLHSLSWKMVLENNIWFLSGLVALE